MIQREEIWSRKAPYAERFSEFETPNLKRGEKQAAGEVKEKEAALG